MKIFELPLLASSFLAVVLISPWLCGGVKAQDAEPWNRLYVTNFGAGTVSVVDLQTARIHATIPVGNGPTGLAVTPDREWLYVANYNSGTVSVISTAANTVEATITIPTRYGTRSAPFGVAVTPDGSRAYVTNLNDGTVRIIDTNTNRVVKMITDAYDWALRYLAISPDGRYAYVVGAGDGLVSVILLNEDRVVAKIRNLPSARHLAFTPDGSRVYVTSEKLSRLYVIDAHTFQVIDTIQFPAGSGTITVDVLPNGRLAYVSNYYGKVAALDLNPQSPTYHRIVGEVPPLSGYQYCIAVSLDGRFAYLSNQADRGSSPNSINIIDLDPASPHRHTIINSIRVGTQPWGVVPVRQPDEFTSTGDLRSRFGRGR